jgi:hypothetical protein
MGPYRWLTVSPPGQPDMEIILMPITAMPGGLDPEGVELMSKLVAKGALGAGIFETDDVKRDYEELKRKGVEFKSPPQEQPYGAIQAVVKDPFGNWFLLSQRKPK